MHVDVSRRQLLSPARRYPRDVQPYKRKEITVYCTAHGRVGRRRGSAPRPGRPERPRRRRRVAPAYTRHGRPVVVTPTTQEPGDARIERAAALHARTRHTARAWPRGQRGLDCAYRGAHNGRAVWGEILRRLLHLVPSPTFTQLPRCRSPSNRLHAPAAAVAAESLGARPTWPAAAAALAAAPRSPCSPRR